MGSRAEPSCAVLYLTQLIGAALLVADQIAGLYVAAAGMVAALTLMISGAWLLVVGVTMREPKPSTGVHNCPSGGRQPLRRRASRLQWWPGHEDGKYLR